MAAAVAYAIVGVDMTAERGAADFVSKARQGVVIVPAELAVHAVGVPLLDQPAALVVAEGDVVVIRRPDAGQSSHAVVQVVGAVGVAVDHAVEQAAGFTFGLLKNRDDVANYLIAILRRSDDKTIAGKLKTGKIRQEEIQKRLADRRRGSQF